MRELTRVWEWRRALFWWQRVGTTVRRRRRRRSNAAPQAAGTHMSTRSNPLPCTAFVLLGCCDAVLYSARRTHADWLQSAPRLMSNTRATRAWPALQAAHTCTQRPRVSTPIPTAAVLGVAGEGGKRVHQCGPGRSVASSLRQYFRPRALINQHTSQLATCTHMLLML